MGYSDAAKVIDRAEVLKTVQRHRIDSAILWADTVIDAHLSAQNAVPFAVSGVPPLVAEVSADLAAYYLLFKENMAGGEDKPVAGAVELYNRALALLNVVIGGGGAGVAGSAPQPTSCISSSKAPSELNKFLNGGWPPCHDYRPY